MKKRLLKRLLFEMEKQNITVYRISKETGLNQSGIARNLNDETQMTLSTYLAICEVLKIKPFENETR